MTKHERAKANCDSICDNKEHKWQIFAQLINIWPNLKRKYLQRKYKLIKEKASEQ